MNIQGKTVNLSEAQQVREKAGNKVLKYVGVLESALPIMFNPTQEQLDELGITDIRLFGDNPYFKETKDGEAFTQLSLLFKFNPSELLNDPMLPSEKYAMYTIGITDTDLVKQKVRTSDGVPFWEVSCIDSRFNTFSITTNTDPATMSKSDLQTAMQDACDFKNKWTIAKLRLPKETKDLPYEEIKEMVKATMDDVDLTNLSKFETKKLLRFNPKTAMIQKKGYLPYVTLLLNISAIDINPAFGIDKDEPFNKKEWSELVAGNVSKINKQLNTLDMYFYTKKDGSRDTETRPTFGCFLYYRKNGEYYNQEVLSPAFPDSNFDLTHGQLARTSSIPYSLKAVIGDTKIKSKLNFWNSYVQKKIFGLSWDGTVDTESAIITYPFDISLRTFDPRTDTTPVISSSTEERSNDTVSDDDDDTPF